MYKLKFTYSDFCNLNVNKVRITEIGGYDFIMQSLLNAK